MKVLQYFSPHLKIWVVETIVGGAHFTTFWNTKGQQLLDSEVSAILLIEEVFNGS